MLSYYAPRGSFSFHVGIVPFFFVKGVQHTSEVTIIVRVELSLSVFMLTESKLEGSERNFFLVKRNINESKKKQTQKQ